MKSQYLNCETKPSLSSRFWVNLIRFLGRCLARFWPILANFSQFLANETLEFFDKIKAGEFVPNNLWFACGPPLTKTTEITKTTEKTKTTLTTANQELSAGLAEIGNHENDETTGIWGANHRFPKTRV